MEGGSHADDGGGLPHQGAHGVLSLVDVAVDLGQRPVVPYRAHQHKGDPAPDALTEDTILHRAGLHEGRDGAHGPDGVDGVDVVVVTVGHAALGVDVLPQGSTQIARLQIVGGQGVARQKPVHKALPHQGGKGGAGVGVKGAGRAQHPDDIPMVPLVPQKLVDGVVVHGIGGLPGPALPEGEGLAAPAALLFKASGVDVDALPAVLGTAHRHHVAPLQAAKLHDGHRTRPAHSHAVHAALLGQHPAAVQAEILGKQGGGVVPRRGHAIPLHGDQPDLRGVLQPQRGKIRGAIGGQRKAHGNLLLLFSLLL